MPDDKMRPLTQPVAVSAFADELAGLLLHEGRIDSKSIERAKRVADDNGSRFHHVLTQLGLISDRVLADAIAQLLGYPVAGPEDYPKEPVEPKLLRAKFLKKARILPVATAGGRLKIAAVDPLDDASIAAVALSCDLPVDLLVALPIDFDAAFERLYQVKDQGSDGPNPDLNLDEGYEDDAARLKDLASEEPLIRLVNQIISRAVETHASDMHLEPFEDRLRLRYRYDGVLQETDAPPKRLHPAIISRIKIMAALDIAERRLPQDGRIKVVVRGHEVDLRVSTIPSLHGERVVLRVLDRSVVKLDFESLGLDENIRLHLRRLLQLPNGIILVTGPTGSGKTTTLYSALIHLNTVERNIITVEDPIEYQLPGITQIQVKPQIGLDFANSLRTILRQDPDIIMIGEIRDLETAQIAVQAALTGHLVLSTLHTNSAAATIARLRDMGLEDYLLTATLNGVVAQRLIRRLCSDCKRQVHASPELVGSYSLRRFTDAEPIVLWEPVGCPKCRNTGYIGRVAVAEILEPDETIHRLIVEREDHHRIQAAASDAGMRTLFDNAVAMALDGTTSLAEIFRSVRLES